MRLVRTAEQGHVDLVVLDAAFLLHPGRGRVAGRLDAAVAAARVAPHAPGIGLVAGVDPLHLDPSAIAGAVAGIDRASGGRAAWQVGLPAGDERLARHAVVAARRIGRLWDHADARTATRDPDGRRRLDHDGIRFAVSRPAEPIAAPHGRPPVVVRVTDETGARAAALVADVVRIVAPDQAGVLALRSAVREAAAAEGRDPDELRVLAEAYVVLAAQRESALARLAMIEDIEGASAGGGAFVVAGTPRHLADVVAEWVTAGTVDGFVLRPAALEADLDAIVTGLVPDLQARGLFPVEKTTGSFRERLGLHGPAAPVRALQPA
ncbi:LLM class flavin-dependent oxidoreductase [Xylanimonas allomyrinae]|uniref:LLM class flavin-dependent oxidoreductase n=1 Tax=Xylanimonas allomyrinae TaxID=2509459 RepID=UPI001FE81B1C|nr:LLM class flavin-dependent oxidoreductase [Xylanimonas allomyrinae]